MTRPPDTWAGGAVDEDPDRGRPTAATTRRTTDAQSRPTRPGIRPGAALGGEVERTRGGPGGGPSGYHPGVGADGYQRPSAPSLHGGSGGPVTRLASPRASTRRYRRPPTGQPRAGTRGHGRDGRRTGRRRTGGPVRISVSCAPNRCPGAAKLWSPSEDALSFLIEKSIHVTFAGR